MKNIFFVLILTLSLISCRTLSRSSDCTLPWDYEAMIDSIAIIKYTLDSVNFHRDSVRILSWFQAKKYDSAYYVNHRYLNGILFWISYHDSASVQHWWIGVAFAFQSSLNQFPPWDIPSGPCPYIYNKYFAHWGGHFDERPTNKDIYGYTKLIGYIGQPFYLWGAKHNPVAFLIASEVCTDTWEACVGEKPTQFFQIED